MHLHTLIQRCGARARWVGSGVVFVLGALLWTHLGVGSQAAYWLGLAPPSTVYHDARADVRPGDLVFRRGRSLVSYAVLYADPTSRYSHVGLVVQTQGDTLVVHATPGPHGEPPAPVRVEPLSVFLAPDHAVQAAVVRAPASHARRAAQVARTYATDARVFDDAFDLATADQLYCTELVWRAYRTAGLDLIDGALDTVALPWASGDRFVLPSTLYRSPHLRVVFPTPVATAPPTRAASALPR